MVRELPRGISGSRFTKGAQAFDIRLKGFKVGMLTLHRVPGDITRHLNKDMERMAERVLKFAKENLEKKVYNPAGVKPESGGPHQVKGYHLSGDLWKSGRWNEISSEKAARETSISSPSLEG